MKKFVFFVLAFLTMVPYLSSCGNKTKQEPTAEADKLISEIEGTSTASVAKPGQAVAAMIPAGQGQIATQAMTELFTRLIMFSQAVSGVWYLLRHSPQRSSLETLRVSSTRRNIERVEQVG